MKLERQEREAEENQAGLSWSSREQWEEMRNRIGTTLTRYGTGGGRHGPVRRRPATISSVVCPQAAEPEADGGGAEAEEHPAG